LKLLVASAPADERETLNLVAQTLEEMIQAACKKQDKLPRHMPIPTYTSHKALALEEGPSLEEQ
jgi:hypothetical protein